MSPAPLIRVRLTAIRFLARDVNAYDLRRSDGAPLPPAEPGAHVDLQLPNGLTRQHSLAEAASSPAAHVLGSKRDPSSRGGSRYVTRTRTVWAVATRTLPAQRSRPVTKLT